MPLHRRPALTLCALEDRTIPTAGNLDPTFGTAGITYAHINPYTADTSNGMTLQTDGKIVLVGRTNVDFSGAPPLIVRMNADGSLDHSFSGDGLDPLPPADAVGWYSGVAELPDGNLLAAGTAEVAGNNQILLARYMPDGTLDPTFGTGGFVIESTVGDKGLALAVDGNGRIIVAGAGPRSSGSETLMIARFNSDGTPDSSFNGTGEQHVDLGPTYAAANSVIVQADGKIVAAGRTSTSGGNFYFPVVRCNDDGSMDTTFNGTGIVTTATPSTSFQWIGQVAELPDGRLLAVGTGGVGGSYHSTPTVLRYNSDGSPDTSLGGTGYVETSLTDNAAFYGVVPLPNGQFVAAGGVGIPGGGNAIVVRYNADGSIDTSFGAGGTLYGPGIVMTDMASNDNDGITSIALQPDGRIVGTGTAGGGSATSLGVVRYFGDAPVGVADNYSVYQGTQLTVNAPGILTNDLNDGAAPQAQLVQGPANASSFTLNADGSFDYLPTTSFSGTDTFTYQVVNGSFVSPPTTVSIDVKPAATLTFSAAGYPVQESDGNATITVQRLFSGTGAVTVHYATTDGTATSPADYNNTSGTLSWADGDTSDKTITVPIIADALSEGDETFSLTLSAPTGVSVLGAQPTATVTIAKNHPLSMGTTFTDADGDLVTVKMSGPVGNSAFYLTNGSVPISEIDLIGTDPLKSSLSIVVKKPKGGTGDGRVGVSEIVIADGSGVKSVSMATADIVGAGVSFNGYVGGLTLGNIAAGSHITLSGAAPAKAKPTKITAGVIGDGAAITVVGQPLGSLTATSVGTATITAPAVGSIIV
jgi:uncharacterized delta-60 repeat protein